MKNSTSLSKSQIAPVRNFDMESAELNGIAARYNDVDRLSVALELFWRKYRWENREWYRSIGAYKRQSLPLNMFAVVEYSFYADGRNFNSGQQQVSIAYAAIRFDGFVRSQSVALRHILTNDYGQYECVLSEDSARRDAEKMFAAFAEYLQQHPDYREDAQ